MLRALGGLISGHHRKMFQQYFYSNLGIEASGQGWGNKSGQREKEVWERVKGVELLGSSTVWIWSGDNVGGDLAWTALWSGPCHWYEKPEDKMFMKPGAGKRVSSGSEILGFCCCCCCCCCWRNVQENLSSWELKSSECWEEDLYFKVSRIYLIHKWMSEFGGTRSSEGKSRPRTKAHLLLTRGHRGKVLRGEREGASSREESIPCQNLQLPGKRLLTEFGGCLIWLRVYLSSDGGEKWGSGEENLLSRHYWTHTKLLATSQLPKAVISFKEN